MSSIVLTGDTSGTVTVSAPAVAGTRTITLPAATGTAILEDGSNNLQMNSGFGSSATAYGVRAWVNFNGSGTVSINASGNVSSITDNAVGNYTVNFTTNMPDINYSVSGITMIEANNNVFVAGATDAPTVSAFRLNARTSGNTNYDAAIIYVNFVR
jgi:hypothetical protein